MPTLTKDGPIWTVHLGDGENRFSASWMDSLEQILTQVATSDEPAVLITRGGGKFYSNGLDLDWLATYPDEHDQYVARVQSVFAQVLTLPVPTVAAVNGHAFGAGAMLAMAHDYRVMRSDRGYFCFPEADINIPFTEGMAALIMAKVSARTAVDAMTTGCRYGAAEARLAGLVDAVADLDRLDDEAASLVRGLAGKHRPTLGAIKSTMFADALAALAVGRSQRVSVVSTPAPRS